jgi:hypothetical protein
VRLTRVMDMVWRQGHLSERAIMDAVVCGERPAHLDRCDICAERAVEVGRWLDDVRTDAAEAADAVFSGDRLAAQESQILRRLEQLDSPARVIAFPAASRADRQEFAGRRVNVSWVGVAAAAGLMIGIVGGHLGSRFNEGPLPLPAVVDGSTAQPPVDGGFLDESYDQLRIESLDFIDGITPRMTPARSGG